MNLQGIIGEWFHGKMLFDETLIKYEVKSDYLDEDIQKIIDIMNSDKVPEFHKSCD